MFSSLMLARRERASWRERGAGWDFRIERAVGREAWVSWVREACSSAWVMDFCFVDVEGVWVDFGGRRSGNWWGLLGWVLGFGV